ncbi:trypsin-like serine protease [Mesorhizobium sp. B2-2-3]|uniref:trypsin-like peptidase domain-containing protein n=1 Tax=Mesorhizobium sp. B2-2-3 TaxID=2589963 RepID=UPI00112E5E57|nr:trypsin-like peptidase domain-containing protein [Mesorhizobium sp. B2-2-3]TPM46204.1 trypsin-like serine protease [Mesorhizobium sp. B2-2-3]
MRSLRGSGKERPRSRWTGAREVGLRLTVLDAGGAARIYPAGIDTLKIGRGVGWADFVWPLDDRRVSRTHLVLERQASGDWIAVRQGHKYVEINGRPVETATSICSGDTLTLGSRDGPRLRFDIITQPAGSATDTLRTRTQEIVSGWREVSRKHMRWATAGFVTLLLAVVGTYGLQYLHYREQMGLLAEMQDKLAERERASHEVSGRFPAATINKLKKAAYIVIKCKANANGVCDGRAEEGFATAWPVEPATLVTNAHVGRLMDTLKAGERLCVRSPGDTPRTYCANSWQAHPAYAAFPKHLGALGNVGLNGEFQAATRPGAYDVALLRLDAPVDPATVLDLATPATLTELREGDEVAFAGYLLRDIAGNETAQREPTPELHFGAISSLTNFFMFASDTDISHAQLIHNSIPITGGASGGPVVDRDGNVVAVVSSGSIIADASSDSVNKNYPSAALVNYAQRADLVRDMLPGGTFDMTAEKKFWDEEAKKFADHESYVTTQFLAEAAGKLNSLLSIDAKFSKALSANLPADQTSIDLEEGQSYAVFAYIDGVEPMQVILRRPGHPDCDKTGRWPGFVFTADRTEEAKVIVFSNTAQNRDYRLTLYKADHAEAARSSRSSVAAMACIE